MKPVFRRLSFASALVTAGAAGVALIESGVVDHAIAGPKAARATPAKTSDEISPQVLFLVRSALAALQDANATGNYSVLRDLAAPSFKAKHTAADLAVIFAAARQKPIDLGAILVAQPSITGVSRPQSDLMLINGVIGNAPHTKQARVAFALQFEAVNGHWRIAGLSVSAP